MLEYLRKIEQISVEPIFVHIKEFQDMKAINHNSNSSQHRRSDACSVTLTPIIWPAPQCERQRWRQRNWIGDRTRRRRRESDEIRTQTEGTKRRRVGRVGHHHQCYTVI